MAAAETLRVGLYHTELGREGPGLLLRDIQGGNDPQVRAVIRVLRAARADVLVLAGVDYDFEGRTLGALAEAIGGYPFRYAARPNRGWQSGLDLDGDGRTGGMGDAFGWGRFAGQGGLAVLSRLPIAVGKVRDHSRLRWSALPGNIAPAGTHPEQRLSTSAHWEVPLALASGKWLTLLIWHATPPVFDGPEDRNGRRNHDEAAFWRARLDGFLGPPPEPPFLLAGFANLDPEDGDGRPAALRALLTDPRLTDPRPRSAGGAAAARRDGGVNLRHRGDPALDTADWGDKSGRPGNLRVDYLLPSADLRVAGSGVLWPEPDTSLGRDVVAASRHRLVWLDLAIEGGRDGGQRVGGAKTGEEGGQAPAIEPVRHGP